jgi:uncharacterized tellurite resistance protein B-like protein
MEARPKEMRRLEQFTNLLVMAVADGGLSEREFKFLLNRSARWGITDEQFSAALEYACSAQAELRIPVARNARIEMLQDLIRIMGADGSLSEVEKRLFATAAATMKLSREELNAIIDGAVKHE